MVIIRDMPPCSLAEMYQCFTDILCLRHQDQEFPLKRLYNYQKAPNFTVTGSLFDAINLPTRYCDVREESRAGCLENVLGSW
jgi:hypothetical protein